MAQGWPRGVDTDLPLHPTFPNTLYVVPLESRALSYSFLSGLELRTGRHSGNCRSSPTHKVAQFPYGESIGIFFGSHLRRGWGWMRLCFLVQFPGTQQGPVSLAGDGLRWVVRTFKNNTTIIMCEQRNFSFHVETWKHVAFSFGIQFLFMKAWLWRKHILNLSLSRPLSLPTSF